MFIFKQRRRLHKYVDTDTTIQSEFPVSVEAETNISDEGHPSVQQQVQNSEQTRHVPGAPNRPSDTPDVATTSPEALAVRAYCKYAVLFFLALLITWVSHSHEVQAIEYQANSIQVPSSANRVYALSMSNQYHFGLTYASSFVLPLQGFWNMVIYITVSWRVFKMVPSQVSRVETRSLPTLLAGRLQRRVWDIPFVNSVKEKLGYQ